MSGPYTFSKRTHIYITPQKNNVWAKFKRNMPRKCLNWINRLTDWLTDWNYIHKIWPCLLPWLREGPCWWLRGQPRCCPPCWPPTPRTHPPTSSPTAQAPEGARQLKENFPIYEDVLSLIDPLAGLLVIVFSIWFKRGPDRTNILIL